MLGKLLMIFILIPFVEIMILIKMGDLFGFAATVLLVVVTGFAGALLAKIEGLRAWNNIQRELQAGRVPGELMIDALILFVAGVFLITPGLLTDITGLLLLIPQTRFFFKRWLRKKFDEMIRRAQSGGSQSGFRFYINE